MNKKVHTNQSPYSASHSLLLIIPLVITLLLITKSAWAHNLYAAAVYAPIAAPALELAAAAYYVAPNGNDANPGTQTAPFGSIQKAANLAGPGTTIYLRGGVYHEAVGINNSGTATQPIVMTNYPGERPVIDGAYTLPEGQPARYNTTVQPNLFFVWEALVRIKGSHIRFSGIEVMRSLGRGIIVGYKANDFSTDVRVQNCSAHDTRNAPLLVLYADNVLIEGCDFYYGSNYATHDRPATELNWPSAVSATSSNNVTFRGNLVHENWGEGLAPTTDSTNVIVENNVIYDNFALQLYIHRSQHVLVQRNLLYHTNNPLFRRGGDPSTCIALNNEDNFVGSIMVRDVTIINNIMVGCQRNLAFWNPPPAKGMFTQDVWVRNNTLVNAVVNNSSQSAVGISIAPAHFVNINIEKNLIAQMPAGANQWSGWSPTGDGFNLARNFWSKLPISYLQSPTDLIGDPQLTNINGALTAGGVRPEWYNPQPGSVARANNLGAFEFYGPNPPVLPGGNGNGTPPTPTATPQPGATATPVPPTPVATPTPISTRPATGCAPSVTNGLVNPGFESGTVNWRLITNGSGTFAAAAPAQHCTSAARLQISRAGNNVQFYQNSVALEPNALYRLSFVAFSNTGHDLDLYLHKHSGSHANYGLKGTVVNLTTGWRTYSVEFTTEGFNNPVKDGRLRFWMAPYDAAGDVYWIDNVQLEKASVPANLPADVVNLNGGAVAAGEAVGTVMAAENLDNLPAMESGIGGLVQLMSSGEEDASVATAANIQVTLVDATSAGATFQSSALTDGNGLYQFAGLADGDYLLAIAPPAGYVSAENQLVTVSNGNKLEAVDTFAVAPEPSSLTQKVFLPVVIR